MKKTFVKILNVFFCTLLIAMLAIPCFSDPLDLREFSQRDNREAADVYMEYSFLDDGVLGRGDSLWSFASDYVISSSCIDLLFSDGAYLRIEYQAETRTAPIDNFPGVIDYIYSYTLYRENLYSIENQVPFLVDDTQNLYLTVGVDGFVFLDRQNCSSYVLSTEYAFRICDFTANRAYYFGCTDSDFVTEVSTDDFVEYCLTVQNETEWEYTGGLFSWIEERFLPLFGEIPDEEIDVGILGTWSPLQLVRTALWVSLGGVCVSAFVVLPFVLLLRLTGIKKRRKGSGKG